MKAFGWPLVAVVLLFVSVLPGCGATPVPRNGPTDYDVIVVGAGMGGLSAATHLAVAGMKVLVLEQHYKVGGCTTSFSRGDYNFEVALHEMSLGGGEDGLIRKLYEQAGISDKVELIRVPELVRSIFPGVDFTMPADIDEAKAALSARWPHEKENVERFFKLMAQMHDELSELRNLYLGSPVYRLFTKLAVPVRQRTLTRYSKHTLQEILDEYFTDAEIKAVIGQLWMYQGPPPSRQWGLVHLMMNYTYMLNGAWQIKGSSQALSDAYRERIEELGGVVKTDARVTKIIIDDDDRVRGVEVDGKERFTSRYVVSNADPFQTFFKLIGEDKTPKKLAKYLRSMKPSNSMTGVYLGLDVEPSFWGVDEYEIFWNTSWDAEAMYESMMKGRYEDGVLIFTFYSNLGDPFYAPPGHSVLVLQTYSDIATWPERDDGYDKHKEEVMDTLIDMGERMLPGLRDHIVVQEGMSPRTIQDYTLNHGGVPYGWDFTPEQSDRLAIPTPIGGLYLAGSWTWPSHSVSMAQTSGYLAARLIMKQEGLE